MSHYTQTFSGARDNQSSLSLACRYFTIFLSMTYRLGYNSTLLCIQFSLMKGVQSVLSGGRFQVSSGSMIFTKSRVPRQRASANMVGGSGYLPHVCDTPTKERTKCCAKLGAVVPYFSQSMAS